MNFVKTIGATVFGLSVLATPAFAETYNCAISPKIGAGLYSGVTPTSMQVTVGRAGTVNIVDNVIKQTGRSSVGGKLGRTIGNVQLFSWTLSPVPRSMLPKTETKFYEPTVSYRARLDTKTGKFSMIGSFVTRISSANSGLNMRGVGTCQRA